MRQSGGVGVGVGVGVRVGGGVTVAVGLTAGVRVLVGVAVGLAVGAGRLAVDAPVPSPAGTQAASNPSTRLIVTRWAVVFTAHIIVEPRMSLQEAQPGVLFPRLRPYRAFLRWALSALAV